MTTEQFTYWLQGYFELSGATTLNEQQVRIIKEHIALVLKKETTSFLTIAPPDNKIYIRGGLATIDPIVKVKEDLYCTAKKDTLVDVPTNLTC